MINNPFFSIIIPTYNRASSLKNAIHKIRQQSFNNWECIIIDDGSTDNTKELLKEIIDLDTQITYFYQHNKERSIARNNGATKAKGQYFIFLDSDDEFENNHLELLYHNIVKTNTIEGMYFTNGKIKTENTIELIDTNIPNILPIDYFINNSVVPARVCLHHSIFNKYRFDPNAIIVEDTVLWTEILDNYPVQYIAIDSVIYNWHGDNSVNIEKYNAYNQRLKGLSILFDKKEVGKKISATTKKKHLNRCYIGISHYYSLQNNKIKSSIWLVISILKYPSIDFKHKIKLLFKIL